MLPQSSLVAWLGYQTFPCYVSAQSEVPPYAKMASWHACFFPSISSSPEQDAPQKDITFTIQTPKEVRNSYQRGEKSQNLMGFAKGEIASKGRSTPGCCLATSWLIDRLCPLIKICRIQHPKQGNTHCRFTELLLWPGSCRLWRSPVQTKTDGEGGKTPQSVFLSPFRSLPLHKHWVTLAFSPCVHTSFSVQALTHSCYLPPGPPSASASPAKAELLGLKQALKAPWELIDNH